MDGQHIEGLPFSVRVLQRGRLDHANSSQPNSQVSLDSLLPASYRAEREHSPHQLYLPNLDDVEFFEQELDLQRLHSILSWLWVAGRPMPPRPLHYQRILGREIFIAERMDMHLVWADGRIFLKPIPRFLLEPSFWTDHMSCRKDCPCWDTTDKNARVGAEGCRRGLQERALGFLYSYAALVAHESDFRIAQEKCLLPTNIIWADWRTLVAQILKTKDIERKIDARFIYGELRLSRLNKIYVLSRRPLFRGYMAHWQQYGTFLGDNLALLASTTVYIAIVLTAMQVGQATSLAENGAFRSASYGFTVFAILGPLVVATCIFLAFSYIFVDNWVEAAHCERKRLRALQTRAGGS